MILSNCHKIGQAKDSQTKVQMLQGETDPRIATTFPFSKNFLKMGQNQIVNKYIMSRERTKEDKNCVEMRHKMIMSSY